VTSVHRDGRYIVAVVMGGPSSLERDAHMRELIGAQIKGIALKRAAPVIAKSNQPNETKPALAYMPVASQGNPLDPIQPLSSSIFQTTQVQSASLAPTPQPQPSAQVAARWLPPAPPDDATMTAPTSTVIEKNPLSHGDPTVPNQPLSVKTATFQRVRSTSLAPMPALVPVAANAPQPSAQVAARWLPPPAPADAPMSAPATTVMEKSTLSLSRGGDPTISNQPRLVKTITIHTGPVQSASFAPMPEAVPVAATTPQPSAQVAARWLPPAPPADQSDNVVASIESTPLAQTPAALAFSEPAKLKPEEIKATKLAGARVELAKVETVSAPVKSDIAASASYAPPHVQDEWLIQIGAFDREDEARQHLNTARLKVRDALAAAHPLTDHVQKGDKVLYRARFTGLNKETAVAACQQLRRSDMDCIALKN